MKDQKPTNKEMITIDEVIENFKVLRLWHISTCVVSAFLVCCMIGAVIWGIMFTEMRAIIIGTGIMLGICGAVLFVVVHRTYIKASSSVLDYFRLVGKMSEDEILAKARELKIPQKAKKTK